MHDQVSVLLLLYLQYCSVPDLHTRVDMSCPGPCFAYPGVLKSFTCRRLIPLVSPPAQHHDPSQEDCSLTLRCLHYPPVDNSKIPANYWRAGSHTDFDTLTLLFQVIYSL